MSITLIAEKPSAARHFATALGGMNGTFNGEQYTIVAARGHLFEFKDPSKMVSPSLEAKYKQWKLENLPWDPSALNWEREQKDGAGQVIAAIKAAALGASEIAIASDIDPTGEGDLLVWEIIDELNLHGKKITRLTFTDEAPKSLRDAFTNRRTVTSMQDEPDFRKADFRSKWDLLSMQFTRIATVSAAQSAVLRQGRLKSSMITLVGDQLKAYNAWKKVPSYQNRFRDENGVLYTNPEEPVFPTEAQVPKSYQPSKVVLDGRTNKRTAPRRLLDLAALSSRLSGKGVKADVVLSTYQKLYEDQVVSYPRTEDKTITTEQFNELLPLVDKIAAVVGVDPSILTVRTPRKTHVKDAGAHGANRPGPNVPPSLEAVEKKYGATGKMIYEELARSYLAMLAEDYVYESQEGHIEAYPDFTGRASVPKSPGWKQVFSDTDADDTDENAKGLGTQGDPVVYEIIPPRPEHPSMKWLMKQLEKRDVGTGATRTSTYAEVTNSKSKNPLLSETRGKITMTDIGDMSYRVLPGTRIGDLSVTEQVYAAMKRIAEGTSTTEAELAHVADWVREDIDTMQRNAVAMRKELGLTEQAQQKEKFQGTWSKTGQQVSFNREWGGHRFTDQECMDLLAGKEVAFSATSAKGVDYDVYGELGEGTYSGHKYVGFQKLGFGKKDANGNPLPPKSWGGHTFTQPEIDKLAAGGQVYAEDFKSKSSGKNYSTTVRFGEVKGEYRVIPSFADEF